MRRSLISGTTSAVLLLLVGCGGRAVSDSDIEHEQEDVGNSAPDQEYGKDGEAERPSDGDFPDDDNKEPPDEPDTTDLPPESLPMPPSVAPDSIAARFSSLWQLKVAQEDAGEDTSAAHKTECADCVAEASCETVGSCDAGIACVTRHCLCSPDSPTTSSGCLTDGFSDDLASCQSDCFATTDTVCRSSFEAFTQCVVDACESTCQ